MNKLTEARRLRDSGLTYTAIGEALGVSNTAVRLWLVPGAAEKNRENVKKYKRIRAATLEGRCAKSLENSKTMANKHGHVACTATVAELVEAHTGYCDCCGVHEAELGRRLHMDHCHETGKFRGWLCDHCNHAIGKLGDRIGFALAYLQPYSAQLLLQARIRKYRELVLDYENTHST